MNLHAVTEEGLLQVRMKLINMVAPSSHLSPPALINFVVTLKNPPVNLHD